MEDLFFGEGWLDDLLSEPIMPSHLRERVREHLAGKGAKVGKSCKKDWERIGSLLEDGAIGAALEAGMDCLRRAEDAVLELEELGGRLPERTFSPFLVRNREIRTVLHPREDLMSLVSSGDDLEAVLALELLNDIRRLLASWGLNTWGREPLKLIPRLEEDLEELRRIQAVLRRLEDSDEEDFEAELEMADRFASAATRFARDLFELHLLNARNPEVRLRFGILWKQVDQLLQEENTRAAVQEAFQILEEALQTAGLGGGELLEMVDILYDDFADPEGLRRAVDRLTLARRDKELTFAPEEEKEFVEAIHSALEDMGLAGSPR